MKNEISISISTMVFSVSPDLFNRDLQTDANYQTQLCNIFNIAALHIKAKCFWIKCSVAMKATGLRSLNSSGPAILREGRHHHGCHPQISTFLSNSLWKGCAS